MMPKTLKVTVSLLITMLLIAAAILFLNTTSAKADSLDKQLVHQLFDDYFKAIKSGNIDAVMNMVIDTRWHDAASQRAGYEAIAREDEIYNAKVLEIKDGPKTEYGPSYNVRISD